MYQVRARRAVGDGRIIAASVILVLASAGAEAVVIQGSNSVAPAGIANVGRRGGGSAIYLGNGWVITANHVGKGSVVFGTTTYAPTSHPAIQLYNPGTTYLTDIILFQLEEDPGLPALDIVLTSPTVGQTVTMAGFGREREEDLTYWDAQGSTWVVSTPGQADYSGYMTTSTRSLVWGTNTVVSAEAGITGGGRAVLGFTTRMDQIAGDEAQGVEGDSGGAVFVSDPGAPGQTWLAGMMHSVYRHMGQPDETAVYGNTTNMSRLAEYREQIIEIITYENVPEPGSVVMIGLAGMAMVRRRWVG